MTGDLGADRIVAVGLLTAGELARLGLGLDRVWPIDDAPCFEGLIAAIDAADRRFKEGAGAAGAG